MFVWSNLGAAVQGTALKLPRKGALLAVHAFDDGGSGFNAGTVTMQGSVDGTNWFTLKTHPGGGDVTFDADGYEEVSTGVNYIRPSTDATVSNVTVKVAV